MIDKISRPAGLIHRASGDPTRIEQLGPYAIESLISREEECSGTAYRVRIAPHSRTSVSFHRLAEEYYFVLAGSGIAVLNDRAYPLHAGDFLRLPPGTTHGFVTEEDALDLLDIHTPGCRPDRDTYFVDAVPEGFAPRANPSEDGFQRGAEFARGLIADFRAVAQGGIDHLGQARRQIG